MLNVSQLARTDLDQRPDPAGQGSTTALGGNVLNIAIGSTGNGSFVARRAPMSTSVAAAAP